MKSVAIIGAGITGLTAGFYLERRGIPVTVYEMAGRVGGAIGSVRRAGFLAELGPNTILETSAAVTSLVDDAGLRQHRLDPAPGAEARYLVRRGRLVELPGSALGFLATSLFSPRAKLAVLREPFRPARRDGAEESVADFVRRRLGAEFLDRAVDALVAGIYAGDPEQLSVGQAFPRLAALEEEYGSLIRGQILGARRRKRRGEIARDRAPKFSFDEGLQVLPDALREKLGGAVRLATRVTGLTRTTSGFRIELLEAGRAGGAEHGAVLHAGTAFGLAELRVVADTPVDLSPFAGIRYPPVASVVLGFRREDVAHPCRAFGMLIPRSEGFRILGTIFSSSLFPNRAPAGHLTLTSYVGGERQPELAALPEAELAGLVCEELRVLLGVRAGPVFHHTAHWPRAIPQYNLGYGRYRERMADLERRAPGLFLAGHYRDGISLGDSIASGVRAAERIAAHLQAPA